MRVNARHLSGGVELGGEESHWIGGKEDTNTISAKPSNSS
jgi:hypothetical protein